MTRSWRVLSSFMLLLAVIGLPIAAVVCELACPDAFKGAMAAVAARPVVGAPASPSCHEAGGGTAHAASGQPVSGQSVPGAAGPPSSSRAHGCDHPSVTTAPRSEDSLRVPQPTWQAALAPTSASPLARVQRVSSAPGQARPPASPPVAFSLVLRI